MTPPFYCVSLAAAQPPAYYNPLQFGAREHFLRILWNSAAQASAASVYRYFSTASEKSISAEKSICDCILFLG